MTINVWPGRYRRKRKKRRRERGWKKKRNVSGKLTRDSIDPRVRGYLVFFNRQLLRRRNFFFFLSGLNKQTFFPLPFSFSPSFPFALFTNPFFHSIVAFGNVRTFREPLTQEHSIWGKNVPIPKCFIRWRSRTLDPGNHGSPEMLHPWNDGIS